VENSIADSFVAAFAAKGEHKIAIRIGQARALGRSGLERLPRARAWRQDARKHAGIRRPPAVLHSAVLHSAATANVDTVIVNGRILKLGGKIVDVEAVQRGAAESFYLVRLRAGGQWAPQAWERPV
jgi:hypothetical protein